MLTPGISFILFYTSETLLLYYYIQKTASILQVACSERGRSSKNDREDVDQEVPVPDMSTVIWY